MSEGGRLLARFKHRVSGRSMRLLLSLQAVRARSYCFRCRKAIPPAVATIAGL